MRFKIDKALISFSINVYIGNVSRPHVSSSDIITKYFIIIVCPQIAALADRPKQLYATDNEDTVSTE